MTVRPLDYGDYHPSDADDTAPDDPTSAYVERDYKVRQPVPVAVRPTRKDTPDLQVEKDRTPKRDTYNAIIVSRMSEGTYWVLRQDGFRLQAKILGDNNPYEGYTIGDDVVLIEGQVPNTWTISGRMHQTEMASIRLVNSNTQTTQNGNPLILDSIVEQTDDEAFSVLVDGTLRVNKDLVGEYEISVTAVIEMLGQTQRTDTIIITFQATQDRHGEDYVSAQYVRTLCGPATIPGLSGGAFRAYDTDHFYPKVLNNGYGIAIWNPTTSSYSILQAQQQALTAVATCNESGGIPGSVTPIAITSLVATSPSPFNLRPTGVTSAMNAYKHRGQIGDKVALVFNGDLSTTPFDIVDVSKRDLKEFSDIRVNSQGTWIEVFQATVAMEYSTSPPIWTQKLELGTCGTYNG